MNDIKVMRNLGKSIIIQFCKSFLFLKEKYNISSFKADFERIDTHIKLYRCIFYDCLVNYFKMSNRVLVIDYGVSTTIYNIVFNRFNDILDTNFELLKLTKKQQSTLLTICVMDFAMAVAEVKKQYGV